MVIRKANAQKQYTAQHLAATDHLNPAGGNSNVRGWWPGQSVSVVKIDRSKKLAKTLINVNENQIQNIASSTSSLSPVAPIINIKIHPPSSTADTGSDCILIRQTDAVAAKLEIQDTIHPLRVRFPDGEIASSIGTSEVAPHRQALRYQPTSSPMTAAFSSPCLEYPT
jgi:hypothetical protein